MPLRALLVLIGTLAFVLSPFLVPGFGGFEPSQFPVPLTEPQVQPAGYAFSIWGVIYAWLLVSAAYGLWKRPQSPEWDAARLPLLVSAAVGAAWLPVALASPIWATLLIWVMLVAALLSLLRTPSTDPWLLRGPLGLYAGWLTAASSVSIGLLGAGWGVPPVGETGWAIIALGIGLVIAGATVVRVPSVTYGVAVVWALVAVVVQNGANPVGLFAGAGAIVIALTTGFAVKRMDGRSH